MSPHDPSGASSSAVFSLCQALRWKLLGHPRRLPQVPRLADDAGMATAEYAIATVAAAAFGALLYTVVTGDSALGALTDLVKRALDVNF